MAAVVFGVMALGGWMRVEAQNFVENHAAAGANLSNWTPHNIAGTSTWAIQDGSLRSTGGSGFLIHSSQNTGDGDFTVRLQGANNDWAQRLSGIVFRYSSPSSFYALHVDVPWIAGTGTSGYGTIRLFKNRTNYITDRDSMAVAVISTGAHTLPGNELVIRVELRANTISVYCNDVLRGSFVDPEPITGGGVGYIKIDQHNPGNARFLSSSWESTLVDPTVRRLTITNTGTGTTSPIAGFYDIPRDSDTSIVATPGAGMTVVWTNCPDVSTDGLTCNVTMDINRTVNATFVPRSHTVTITPYAGTVSGTTSPIPGTYTHNEGANVSIVATPSAGNSVLWNVEATGCDRVSANGLTCHIDNITANKTVTATFIPPVYQIANNWYAWNTATGNVLTPGVGNQNWTGGLTWSTTSSLTAPIAWPTPVGTANSRNVVFAGSTPGVNIIVNSAVTVDTIEFQYNGFAISSPATGSNTLIMRNGQIFMTPGRSAEISATLGGSSGLAFTNRTAGTGGSILTLSGDNTYTGPTTINSGTTLIASHNNAFGLDTSASTVTVSDASGTSLTLSGGVTIPSTKSLNISGATALPLTRLISSGESNTWGGSVALGTRTGVERITVNSDLTIGGIISGSAPIQKTGTGNLILTGANTYTGVITVGIAASSGGNLQIGAGGETGSILSPVVLTNGNIIFNRSGTIDHVAVISGTGSLTKLGTGVLTLTNATYNGPTTIVGGTLRYTTTAPSSSAITNNAVLEFSNDVPMVYSGAITGTGRINKTLQGSLTLTGSNNVGSLTVEQGAVNIMPYTGTNRLTANSVIVAAGATLGGSPRVTLPAGGTISVGGTIGSDSGSFNVVGGNVEVSAGGTIITGDGGSISRLTMISASTMRYRMGGHINVVGALTLGGTLDVGIDPIFIAPSEAPFDIAYFGTITPDRFHTVIVNGDTVARYDANGAILGQNPINDTYFHIEVDEADEAAKKVLLVLSDGPNTNTGNIISVTRAELRSTTQADGGDLDVELIISGITAASAFNNSANRPFIDSIGVWYRPNGPISYIDSTGIAPGTTSGAVLIRKVPFDSLVTLAAGTNACTIKVSVPAPVSPAAGVYGPDNAPFYFFHVKEYWITQGSAAGAIGQIQGTFVTSGESVFMRTPSHVVAPNELIIQATDISDPDANDFKIEIAISGFAGANALPDSSAPHKPFVDSIGVWRSGGTAGFNPPRPLSSADYKFSLAAMKDAADAYGIFRHTIDVTEIMMNPSANSIETFYFAVAPRWRRIAFENAAAFDSVAAAPLAYTAHNCSVLVVKGDQLNNPLTLTGVHGNTRGDTVAITITASEPLHEEATEVRVRFSFNPNMVPLIVPERTILASDILTAFDLVSDAFPQERQLVYWSIVVHGENPSIAPSRAVTSSFEVGRPRPAALQNFIAIPVSHNTIHLRWNSINLPAPNGNLADGSLRPNGESAYILIRRSATEFTSAGLDRDGYEIMLSARDASILGDPSNVRKVNDTTIAITGIGETSLSELTNYWFAGAVMDSVASAGGAWNLISTAVIRDTSTVEITAARNVLEIENIEFNYEELRFTVTYSLTEPVLPTDNLKFAFRVSVNENETFRIGPFPIEAVFGGAFGTFDTTISSANMLFDTTWHVFLYTHEEVDDVVSWSAPVRGTYDVKGFVVQTAVVGGGALDLGFANNARFRVQAYEWSDVGRLDTTTFDAVIRRRDGDEFGGSVPNFVFVSAGYNFSAGSATTMQKQQPVSFSIKTERALPADSMSYVRLYKWNSGCNSNRGCWEVEFNYRLNDPQPGWVTGIVDSIDNADGFTYRLMIDTQRPKLFFNGAHRENFVKFDEPLDIDNPSWYSEVFSVEKANVGNYRVTMHYSAANNLLPADAVSITPSAPIAAQDGRRGVTIPRARMEELYDLMERQAYTRIGNSLGVRAFLVVNDGRHIDTINISRPVKYKTYFNQMQSGPGGWVPLAAQAQLDKRTFRDVLGPLFKGEESDDYDKARFRIYRYNRNRWVEYSDNDTVFNLETGRLFWIKTAGVNDMEFETGAVSHCLIEPYEVSLDSAQWIDFMLPFRFDVTLGDIFEATYGADFQDSISNLEIYKWEQERGSDLYRPQMVFLGGITNSPIGNERYNPRYDTLVLSGGRSDPFTVFNSGRRVTLKVPPVLAAMSKHRPGGAPLAKIASMKRTGGSDAWFFTVNSRVGSAHTGELMAGYNLAARKYSVPPTFSSESVVLIDDRGNETGHFFSPDFANGGRTFKLRFTNGQNQRVTFSFNAKASMFAPGGMQVMFVNASTGELIEGKSEYNISVNASSHEDVYMVVGTKDYLAKTGVGQNMKFMMGSVAVNQAARSARIRYYVPFAGVDRVEVTAYNLKGTVVWKNTQKAQSASWNTMEWNSRSSGRGGTAAGLYIVRVRALNAKGKTVAVADRRLTFAP